MSLGQPALYIGGQLMQTYKADPRPALAGLRLGWGTDSRLDADPASTLSGQLLIRGAMPDFLQVGAPVGLVDPVSARCLFAGTLGPLTAAPDDSVKGALRVSFTAASPLSELVKHKVLDFDWPWEETAANRCGRIAASMPAGWNLNGIGGWNWINHNRQKYQSMEWLTLLQRYVNSYGQRYHDTSTYTPGAGLYKRITLSSERDKQWPLGVTTDPGPRGGWLNGGPNGASGISVLPAAAIRRDINWEKTPADVITDVQLSSWGGPFQENDSTEFEFLMSAYVDNSALQAAYGYRQIKIETTLSLYTDQQFRNAVVSLVNYWLDTQSHWRPTELQIPDSRLLDTAPLLNLLAVDTRPMAVLDVPLGVALAPGKIRSFVAAGAATWTGKKWTTDLTLGRTLT